MGREALSLSLSDVEAMLSYIDSSEREVWVNVGNALKGEFGGNGLDSWLDWSASAPNYDRKAALSVWRSLKRLVVPIGYVLKLAKQNGYVHEAPRRVLTEAEIAERKAKQDALRMQEELARAKGAEQALVKSHILWAAAAKHGRSAYLAKKQVHAESVRFLPDGSILVPMMDYTKPREVAFVGVQTIKNDGTKLFPAGVAKSGSACRLGEPREDFIALCEGYATGASLRMAMDGAVPVFVAFDAGNLLKVARVLRALYPKAHVLICCDNDRKTKGNPGISAGKKALREIRPNASVIYPIFRVEEKELTDFNDLHVKHGLAAVKRQLEPVLRAYQLLTGVVA